MSNSLGSIYATTKTNQPNGLQKYIMLDSQNVEVSGNFFINGTNSRMPAEIENSLKDYLPLTYGITDPNSSTLFEKFEDLSLNLLTSNNDASFNNVDVSGDLTVNGNVTANNIGTPDFGRFSLNSVISVGSGVVANINNLIAVGTLNGITIVNGQNITTSTAGTYKLSWNFNIQQTSGANGSYQFNVFQNGVFQTFQKRYLVNFENVSGSFILTQAAAITTYSFSIGQGNVSFNLINPSYSQISIEKLF